MLVRVNLICEIRSWVERTKMVFTVGTDVQTLRFVGNRRIKTTSCVHRRRGQERIGSGGRRSSVFACRLLLASGTGDVPPPSSPAGTFPWILNVFITSSNGKSPSTLNVRIFCQSRLLILCVAAVDTQWDNKVWGVHVFAPCDAARP